MWNGNVQRGKLPPEWLKHAKAEEIQRVSVIDDRLERKLQTVKELNKERRAIMTRCVRRMRRATGKD